MTAWTWYAHNRYVSGLSATTEPTAPVLLWGSDPSAAGSTLPWALPEYPTLLVLGIGVTLTTSAVAGNRRAEFALTQVGGGLVFWRSMGTQAAGLVRRWEFGVGFSLETTLASDVFREPLPRGLIMLPGDPTTAVPNLTLGISGVQAGDAYGAVSIRGALLYP